MKMDDITGVPPWIVNLQVENFEKLQEAMNPGEAMLSSGVIIAMANCWEIPPTKWRFDVRLPCLTTGG